VTLARYIVHIIYVFTYILISLNILVEVSNVCILTNMSIVVYVFVYNYRV
jgi:hypothetical protein